ncbi:MAG TPA: ABC transporter permease [Candidatus Acidoferrum sp.]|nr:ABC transporter permease [Candidatus Acidoferrum sp.]
MRGIRRFFSRLRNTFAEPRKEERMREEMEEHLALETAELVRSGLPEAEARRQARLKFGGMETIEEDYRAERRILFLETLWQDLRYGFRMLRKSPGFTAVAVFTLALGVGANTAIFSVVYAELLKPLPFVSPERLYTVFQQEEKDATQQTGISFPNLEDLNAQSRLFEGMTGTTHHQLTLTGRGQPQVIETSIVTSEFFTVFKEKPLAGREFLPEDFKPGGAATVLLSENLWRGKFGGDPGIIGSSITLDKTPYTVIGVLPASFRFPAFDESEQVWIPLVHDPFFGPWIGRRVGHWLQITGRLKPGVTPAQASAELDGIGQRLVREYPAENSGWLVRMMPLRQLYVADVKPALLVLMGAVCVVLLIACANLANLLLARGTTRAREFAVRSTLGAGRGRLIRQLMAEAAVLGLLGGTAGVLLAIRGVRVLSPLVSTDLPAFSAIRIDYFVLCFALVVSAIAVCGFALAPAFLVAKVDLQKSLREGDARGGETAGGRRIRSVLAAAELALAIVLLVTAGLMLRSFANLTSVSPGFDVQHVLKANIALPRAEYSTPQQWLGFANELLSRVQAEPGLREAALAVPTPLADGCVNLGFDIVDRPPLSAAESRTADYVSVSQNYFHILNIPLLAGRTFDERDGMSSPRVAVISLALARKYFPNEDPIGKQMVFGFPPDGEAAREIVGIVGDVRDVDLGTDPGPMMYVPYSQAPFAGSDIIVKSPLDAGTVAASVRRVTASIDKDLPVGDISTLTDAVNASVAEPKFRTSLLVLFAAMAVVLAATGIFGVISYSVSCRTKEIGIRVALGASRGSIVQMVSREVLLLTLGGIAAGVPCALAASRLLGHMLFGVSAADPLTLAGVALALVAVAVVAGCVPARRAMSVDPMVALRHE